MNQVCKGCGSPVEDTKENYNMFEQMHWVCFHFAYEHSPNDPDTPCDSRHCPTWQLQILKDYLTSIGENPELIIDKTVKLHLASSAKT